MSEIKTAFAIVESQDYRMPEPRIVPGGEGIERVIREDKGQYLVTFKPNYFTRPPAVQVTAMWSGFSGTKLSSVIKPSLPGGYTPANMLVFAYVEFADQDECRLRTTFQTGEENWLSFSITATGR